MTLAKKQQRSALKDYVIDYLIVVMMNTTLMRYFNEVLQKALQQVHFLPSKKKRKSDTIFFNEISHDINYFVLFVFKNH